MKLTTYQLEALVELAGLFNERERLGNPTRWMTDLPWTLADALNVALATKRDELRKEVAGALREAAVAAQPVRDAEPMARQVLDLVVADLRRRADESEQRKDVTRGSLD
ncbi:MAG: hypothetical protein IMZ62_12870 [Chloroflexi bacterium]|nr:hypothetical protein [Chloroflexota bacterium]MBE3119096.1 hypothetical protein [Candidatus Atribacteria bacterium]